MAKFYIANSIPYVNAKPHIGHALEFIQSDVIARYHRILGDETLLLCGGDENAIKNVQAAEETGLPIQEFIDKNSRLFLDLSKKLNVQFDVFQKGSAKNHYESSKRLWQLCSARGDIYKKQYTGLYCVGCELFYEKGELNQNGECFEHPGKKLQEVSEENYFFKLSKYQEAIKKLIQNEELKIIPVRKRQEVLSFLERGLKDISISRSNARAKNWGVPIPNDDSQRMYVWFDALNIYQSGIGFGWDEKLYQKWWPADVHVIGKGILRFHAIYWIAFLLSAKLQLPKSIFVHEYITANGQKMSKTLGNVVDPNYLIEKYGSDAVRYYLLAKISPFQDGDFSESKFKEVYNADLANGLGNLIARIAKLAEKIQLRTRNHAEVFDPVVEEKLSEFKFNEALSAIWADISALDKKTNEAQPWRLDKPELEEFLAEAITKIRSIALSLRPFLPETAQKIQQQFQNPTIVSQKPLFPRLA